MNNAPFVIDSVFISLSLIKGAYHYPAPQGCVFYSVWKAERLSRTNA